MPTYPVVRGWRVIERVPLVDKLRDGTYVIPFVLTFNSNAKSQRVKLPDLYAWLNSRHDMHGCETDLIEGPDCLLFRMRVNYDS